jgi:excinuclease UvrABC ATPase subunit
MATLLEYLNTHPCTHGWAFENPHCPYCENDHLREQMRQVAVVGDDLERWSNAAAQELQEVLDDAKESGCDQPGIQALLNEHSEIMSRFLEV